MEIPIGEQDVKKKLTIISRLVLIFFLIATVRFVYIQFIMSEKLQEEIIGDRVREVINLPERGQITDRNGNILAMSLITYDIALNPNLIVSEKHQQNIAELLSETIEELNYKDVLKIAEGDAKYKVVSKHLPPDKAKIIRESGIGGIQLSQSPNRLYPNGNLGGTFLGFVNNNNVPGAGLEIKLNSYLAGTKGYTLAEMTPFGDIIPVGSKNTVEPINGQNLNTTTDSYMQHVLEKRLLEAAEEMDPEEMHAVIMDPNNGEILAMASYPSFDPNNYKDYDSATWANTPANFSYEPGSIFKPVFMAAAFENGVIDGTEMYPSGRYNVNGKVIKDWNGSGWGVISAEEIIQHSSNVGMIKIAEKMTDEQIITFLKEQGFHQPTGIELPGEEKGVNFPTVESLQRDPIRRANISFGQGISMTPLQMLTSFSELINGGYKIQPTLIKNVTDNNGNLIFEPEKSNGERSYKETTSDIMKSYLKNNMENGSGEGAQIEGFDAGGKTGSAWYVEDGRYAAGKIIGSFIGFLPYEEPKYSMLISVKGPKGVEFGSTAAGPIFQDVMTEIVRYEGLTPTVKDSIEPEREKLSFNIENYSWKLYEDLKNELQTRYGRDIVVSKEGDGEVIVDQSYNYKHNKLYLTLVTKPLKEEGKYYIPSFEGMSENDIKPLLDKYDIPHRFYGERRVVEQNVEAGMHFKLDRMIFWLN